MWFELDEKKIGGKSVIYRHYTIESSYKNYIYFLYIKVISTYTTYKSVCQICNTMT